MNETLRWGTNEFRPGDRLVAPGHDRVITITDIYKSEENENVFVVLDPEDGYSKLMQGDQFAYRIDAGHFARLPDPAFKEGLKFTHRGTNDTVTIIAISERTDWRGSYQYFVSLVNEAGSVSYTSVNEQYLTGCLPYPDVQVRYVLPDIPLDAVFPSIILL